MRIRPAVLVALLVAAMAPSPAFADTGWTRLDKRVRPFGASAAAMAYDAARGEMVLFPGYDDGPGHGGTWIRRDGEWRRVHPGVEPQQRYGGMMAYDAAREEVVLFGGYGANPDGGQAVALDDTWTWDGERWSRDESPSSPSRRAFAAVAYDAVREEVVLFGGIGIADDGTPFSRLGDTWTWNGTRWTRLEPATSPAPRYGAGMAFDDARGEVVLFGGSGLGTPNECTLRPMNICIDLDNQGGSSGELADTWAWDGATWTQRAPAAAPEARTNMGMEYDPLRQRVVLFSGVDVGGLYWDTWTWDGTAWTEVTPSEQPGPRFSPEMAFDPGEGRVVLWGGHRITYQASDLWGWNGSTWTSLEEPTPSERVDSAMATDPVSGDPLLFGGLGDVMEGDTWVYDDGWRELTPQSAPSPRFNAAATNDTVRGEAVVFGGADATYAEQRDTWVWDGTTWRDRTPALPSLGPPARQSAAMAFDEERGEAVLFGGWNTDLPITLRLSDTWTWDGETWQLEPVVGGPPALRDHMMAYDAARQEVVLYGGIDADNRVVGGTWTWDGEAWTEEQPAESPGPRAESVMVYDPTVERVLLFGGLDSEQPPSVWSWDGDTWTKTPIGPGPRRATFSSMTYAPGLQGSVLFGAGQGARDETWLLRVPPAAVGG